MVSPIKTFCILFCLQLSNISGVFAQQINTGPAGGNQPHNNMQPYTVLRYAIATDATVFSIDASSSNIILGEVRAFTYLDSDMLPPGITAGGFSSGVPGGWTIADGRLLPVTGNSALFSILGTAYGGDGINNFALPDLRGSTPIGVGDGPGLTSVALGDKFGVEEVTLSEQQMPIHDHAFMSDVTPEAGGNMSHSNQMPSLGLNCIIATSGQFPSQSIIAESSSQSSNSTPPIAQAAGSQFLAEMRWYAGTRRNIVGWDYCDGQSLLINGNQALFSLLGRTYGGNGETNFDLPDLRGRTMMHEGSGFNLGSIGGTESVTLNEAQLPTHTHRARGQDTEPSGSSAAHNNLQPYQVIHMLIAFVEVFPSVDGTSDSALIGETMLFASNFAPRGYSFIDGQTLPISSFTALFALIFNAYGGDAMSTFKLPDLQGRVIVGTGQGPELSNRILAESSGESTHVLTEEEMPRHIHGVADDTFCWALQTSSGNVVTNCL